MSLNMSLKCDSGELASTRPTALISLNPFAQPLPYYRPNLVDWALVAVNAVSMHCTPIGEARKAKKVQ